MCVLASQPLRQSSYHAFLRACMSFGFVPRALVPTPFVDDDGCRFAAMSDWALAPVTLRSKDNATKVNPRLGILSRVTPNATMAIRPQIAETCGSFDIVLPQISGAQPHSSCSIERRRAQMSQGLRH